MNKKEVKYQFKVITLGDGAVGKTSIVRRYLGWDFRGNYLPTIGAEFYAKDTNYELEEKLLQITWNVWDISGQPDFSSVRGSYYTGSHGAVVIFDITRETTAEHVKNWVEDFYQTTGTTSPFVLLGNKVDLRGTGREEVPKEEGKRIAAEISEQWGVDVPYIETSAKAKRGLEKAFKILSQKIAKKLGTHR